MTSSALQPPFFTNIKTLPNSRILGPLYPYRSRNEPLPPPLPYSNFLEPASTLFPNQDLHSNRVLSLPLGIILGGRGYSPARCLADLAFHASTGPDKRNSCRILPGRDVPRFGIQKNGFFFFRKPQQRSSRFLSSQVTNLIFRKKKPRGFKIFLTRGSQLKKLNPPTFLRPPQKKKKKFPRGPKSACHLTSAVRLNPSPIRPHLLQRRNPNFHLPASRNILISATSVRGPVPDSMQWYIDRVAI